MEHDPTAILHQPTVQYVCAREGVTPLLLWPGSLAQRGGSNCTTATQDGAKEEELCMRGLERDDAMLNDAALDADADTLLGSSPLSTQIAAQALLSSERLMGPLDGGFQTLLHLRSLLVGFHACEGEEGPDGSRHLLRQDSAKNAMRPLQQLLQAQQRARQLRKHDLCGPRVVAGGMPISVEWVLRSVFPILDAVARSDPLGQRHLKRQVLNVLGGLVRRLPLLALRQEPPSLVEELRRLIEEMLLPHKSVESGERDAAEQRDELACTLVGLALHSGSLEKLLNAILLLLRLERSSTSSECIRMPVGPYLAALHRHMQGAGWSYAGLSLSGHLGGFQHHWLQPEDAPMLFQVQGTRAPSASTASSAAASSAASSSSTSSSSSELRPSKAAIECCNNAHRKCSLACDGTFLYLHSSRIGGGGVAKLGSGLHGTVKGRIYAHNPSLFPGQLVWLVCVDGRLFLRRRAMTGRLVAEVDKDTLQLLPSVRGDQDDIPEPQQSHATDADDDHKSEKDKRAGAAAPESSAVQPDLRLCGHTFSEGKLLYVLSHPLPRRDAHAMASMGLCTYVGTGSDFVRQPWFNCNTCAKGKSSSGCCAVCVSSCHRGHDVVPASNSPSRFYCDCGAGALGPNAVRCEVCITPPESDSQSPIDAAATSADSKSSNNSSSSAAAASRERGGSGSGRKSKHKRHKNKNDKNDKNDGQEDANGRLHAQPARQSAAAQQTSSSPSLQTGELLLVHVFRLESSVPPSDPFYPFCWQKCEPLPPEWSRAVSLQSSASTSTAANTSSSTHRNVSKPSLLEHMTGGAASRATAALPAGPLGFSDEVFLYATHRNVVALVSRPVSDADLEEDPSLLAMAQQVDMEDPARMGGGVPGGDSLPSGMVMPSSQRHFTVCQSYQLRLASVPPAKLRSKQAETEQPGDDDIPGWRLQQHRMLTPFPLDGPACFDAANRVTWTYSPSTYQLRRWTYWGPDSGSDELIAMLEDAGERIGNYSDEGSERDQARASARATSTQRSSHGTSERVVQDEMMAKSHRGAQDAAAQKHPQLPTTHGDMTSDDWSALPRLPLWLALSRLTLWTASVARSGRFARERELLHVLGAAARPGTAPLPIAAALSAAPLLAASSFLDPSSMRGAPLSVVSAPCCVDPLPLPAGLACDNLSSDGREIEDADGKGPSSASCGDPAALLYKRQLRVCHLLSQILSMCVQEQQHFGSRQIDPKKSAREAGEAYADVASGCLALLLELLPDVSYVDTAPSDDQDELQPSVLWTGLKKILFGFAAPPWAGMSSAGLTGTANGEPLSVLAERALACGLHVFFPTAHQQLTLVLAEGGQLLRRLPSLSFALGDSPLFASAWRQYRDCEAEQQQLMREALQCLMQSCTQDSAAALSQLGSLDSRASPVEREEKGERVPDSLQVSMHSPCPRPSASMHLLESVMQWVLPGSGALIPHASTVSQPQPQPQSQPQPQPLEMWCVRQILSASVQVLDAACAALSRVNTHRASSGGVATPILISMHSLLSSSAVGMLLPRCSVLLGSLFDRANHDVISLSDSLSWLRVDDSLTELLPRLIGSLDRLFVGLHGTPLAVEAVARQAFLSGVTDAAASSAVHVQRKRSSDKRPQSRQQQGQQEQSQPQQQAQQKQRRGDHKRSASQWGSDYLVQLIESTHPLPERSNGSAHRYSVTIAGADAVRIHFDPRCNLQGPDGRAAGFISWDVSPWPSVPHNMSWDSVAAGPNAGGGGSALVSPPPHQHQMRLHRFPAEPVLVMGQSVTIQWNPYPRGDGGDDPSPSPSSSGSGSAWGFRIMVSPVVWRPCLSWMKRSWLLDLGCCISYLAGAVSCHLLQGSRLSRDERLALPWLSSPLLAGGARRPLPMSAFPFQQQQQQQPQVESPVRAAMTSCVTLVEESDTGTQRSGARGEGAAGKPDAWNGVLSLPPARHSVSPSLATSLFADSLKDLHPFLLEVLLGRGQGGALFSAMTCKVHGRPVMNAAMRQAVEPVERAVIVALLHHGPPLLLRHAKLASGWKTSAKKQHPDHGSSKGEGTKTELLEHEQPDPFASASSPYLTPQAIEALSSLWNCAYAAARWLLARARLEKAASAIRMSVLSRLETESKADKSDKSDKIGSSRARSGNRRRPQQQGGGVRTQKEGRKEKESPTDGDDLDEAAEAHLVALVSKQLAEMSYEDIMLLLSRHSGPSDVFVPGDATGEVEKAVDQDSRGGTILQDAEKTSSDDGAQGLLAASNKLAHVLLTEARILWRIARRCDVAPLGSEAQEASASAALEQRPAETGLTVAATGNVATSPLHQQAGEEKKASASARSKKGRRRAKQQQKKRQQQRQEGEERRQRHSSERNTSTSEFDESGNEARTEGSPGGRVSSPSTADSAVPTGFSRWMSRAVGDSVANMDPPQLSPPSGAVADRAMSPVSSLLLSAGCEIDRSGGDASALREEDQTATASGAKQLLSEFVSSRDPRIALLRLALTTSMSNYADSELWVPDNQREDRDKGAVALERRIDWYKVLSAEVLRRLGCLMAVRSAPLFSSTTPPAMMGAMDAGAGAGVVLRIPSTASPMSSPLHSSMSGPAGARSLDAASPRSPRSPASSMSPRSPRLTASPGSGSGGIDVGVASSQPGSQSPFVFVSPSHKPTAPSLIIPAVPSLSLGSESSSSDGGGVGDDLDAVEDPFNDSNDGSGPASRRTSGRHQDQSEREEAEDESDLPPELRSLGTQRLTALPSPSKLKRDRSLGASSSTSGTSVGSVASVSGGSWRSRARSLRDAVSLMQRHLLGFLCVDQGSWQVLSRSRLEVALAARQLRTVSRRRGLGLLKLVLLSSSVGMVRRMALAASVPALGETTSTPIAVMEIASLFMSPTEDSDLSAAAEPDAAEGPTEEESAPAAEREGTSWSEFGGGFNHPLRILRGLEGVGPQQAQPVLDEYASLLSTLLGIVRRGERADPSSLWTSSPVGDGGTAEGPRCKDGHTRCGDLFLRFLALDMCSAASGAGDTDLLLSSGFFPTAVSLERDVRLMLLESWKENAAAHNADSMDDAEARVFLHKGWKFALSTLAATAACALGGPLNHHSKQPGSARGRGHSVRQDDDEEESRSQDENDKESEESGEGPEAQTRHLQLLRQQEKSQRELACVLVEQLRRRIEEEAVILSQTAALLPRPRCLLDYRAPMASQQQQQSSSDGSPKEAEHKTSTAGKDASTPSEYPAEVMSAMAAATVVASKGRDGLQLDLVCYRWLVLFHRLRRLPRISVAMSNPQTAAALTRPLLSLLECPISSYRVRRLAVSLLSSMLSRTDPKSLARSWTTLAPPPLAPKGLTADTAPAAGSLAASSGARPTPPADAVGKEQRRSEGGSARSAISDSPIFNAVRSGRPKAAPSSRTTGAAASDSSYATVAGGRASSRAAPSHKRAEQASLHVLLAQRVGGSAPEGGVAPVASLPPLSSPAPKAEKTDVGSQVLLRLLDLVSRLIAAHVSGTEQVGPLGISERTGRLLVDLMRAHSVTRDDLVPTHGPSQPEEEQTFCVVLRLPSGISAGRYMDEQYSHVFQYSRLRRLVALQDVKFPSWVARVRRSLHERGEAVLCTSTLANCRTFATLLAQHGVCTHLVAQESAQRARNLASLVHGFPRRQLDGENSLSLISDVVFLLRTLMSVPSWRLLLEAILRAHVSCHALNQCATLLRQSELPLRGDASDGPNVVPDYSSRLSALRALSALIVLGADTDGVRPGGRVVLLESSNASGSEAEAALSVAKHGVLVHRDPAQANALVVFDEDLVSQEEAIVTSMMAEEQLVGEREGEEEGEATAAGSEERSELVEEEEEAAPSLCVASELSPMDQRKKSAHGKSPPMPPRRAASFPTTSAATSTATATAFPNFSFTAFIPLTVVEIDKLVSAERVPPPWQHMDLTPQLVGDLACFLEQSSEPLPGAEVVEEKHEERGEEKEREVKDDDTLERPPQNRTAPLDVQQRDRQVGSQPTWGLALLSLMKSCAVGVVSSALLHSSTSESDSIDNNRSRPYRHIQALLGPDGRPALQRLLRALRTISSTSRPSQSKDILRLQTRRLLARGIDVASAAISGDPLPGLCGKKGTSGVVAAAASDRTGPRNENGASVLPYQPQPLPHPISEMPCALDCYSAPNVFFSHQGLTAEFVASHSLTPAEEGTPSVYEVVVAADRPIPLGRLRQYYFEVRLDNLPEYTGGGGGGGGNASSGGTGSSNNTKAGVASGPSASAAGPPGKSVGIGLRTASGDWFLGADGRCWTVTRPLFDRRALTVGTYIDVKDTAQRPHKWEPSRVLEESEAKVKVGWLYWENPEYHQWLERRSDLIAPFLYHTSGAAPLERFREYSRFCSPFRAGDVMGCGFDLATGRVFFTRNGRNLGVAFTDVPLRKHMHPAVELRQTYARVSANFGQRPFLYREYDGIGAATTEAPSAVGSGAGADSSASSGGASGASGAGGAGGAGGGSGNSNNNDIADDRERSSAGSLSSLFSSLHFLHGMRRPARASSPLRRHLAEPADESHDRAHRRAAYRGRYAGSPPPPPPDSFDMGERENFRSSIEDYIPLSEVFMHASWAQGEDELPPPQLQLQSQSQSQLEEENSGSSTGSSEAQHAEDIHHGDAERWKTTVDAPYAKRLEECERHQQAEDRALEAEEERIAAQEAEREASRVATAVEMMSMLPGATQEQLMAALEMNGDDLQRTMNWIFNQPDPFTALASVKVPERRSAHGRQPKQSRDRPADRDRERDSKHGGRAAHASSPTQPPFPLPASLLGDGDGVVADTVVPSVMLQLGSAFEYQEDLEETSQGDRARVSEAVQQWLSEVESGLRRARLDRQAIERIMSRLRQDNRDVVALLQAREVIPGLREAPIPSNDVAGAGGASGAQAAESGSAAEMPLASPGAAAAGGASGAVAAPSGPSSVAGGAAQLGGMQLLSSGSMGGLPFMTSGEDGDPQLRAASLDDLQAGVRVVVARPALQSASPSASSSASSASAVSPSSSASASPEADLSKVWLAEMASSLGRSGVVLEVQRDFLPPLVLVRLHRSRLSLTEQWWFPAEQLRLVPAVCRDAHVGLQSLDAALASVIDTQEQVARIHARQALLAILSLPADVLRLRGLLQGAGWDAVSADGGSSEQELIFEGLRAAAGEYLGLGLPLAAAVDERERHLASPFLPPFARRNLMTLLRRWPSRLALYERLLTQTCEAIERQALVYPVSVRTSGDKREASTVRARRRNSISSDREAGSAARDVAAAPSKPGVVHIRVVGARGLVLSVIEDAARPALCDSQCGTSETKTDGAQPRGSARTLSEEEALDSLRRLRSHRRRQVLTVFANRECTTVLRRAVVSSFSPLALPVEEAWLLLADPDGQDGLDNFADGSSQQPKQQQQQQQQQQQSRGRQRRNRRASGPREDESESGSESDAHSVHASAVGSPCGAFDTSVHVLVTPIHWGFSLARWMVDNSMLRASSSCLSAASHVSTERQLQERLSLASTVLSANVSSIRRAWPCCPLRTELVDMTLRMLHRCCSFDIAARERRSESSSIASSSSASTVSTHLSRLELSESGRIALQDFLMSEVQQLYSKQLLQGFRFAHASGSAERASLDEQHTVFFSPLLQSLWELARLLYNGGVGSSVQRQPKPKRWFRRSAAVASWLEGIAACGQLVPPPRRLLLMCGPSSGLLCAADRQKWKERRHARAERHKTAEHSKESPSARSLKATQPTDSGDEKVGREDDEAGQEAEEVIRGQDGEDEWDEDDEDEESELEDALGWCWRLRTAAKVAREEAAEADENDEEEEEENENENEDEDEDEDGNEDDEEDDEEDEEDDEDDEGGEADEKHEDPESHTEGMGDDGMPLRSDQWNSSDDKALVSVVCYLVEEQQQQKQQRQLQEQQEEQQQKGRPRSASDSSASRSAPSQQEQSQQDKARLEKQKSKQKQKQKQKQSKVLESSQSSPADALYFRTTSEEAALAAVLLQQRTNRLFTPRTVQRKARQLCLFNRLLCGLTPLIDLAHPHTSTLGRLACDLARCRHLVFPAVKQHFLQAVLDHTASHRQQPRPWPAEDDDDDDADLVLSATALAAGHPHAHFVDPSTAAVRAARERLGGASGEKRGHNTAIARAEELHHRFPVHINRMAASNAAGAVAVSPTSPAGVTRGGAATGALAQSIFEQVRRQFALHQIHTQPHRLRTPFTPPQGVKPLLPFDVHLKGEKVVGFDGPYRALFADISRELQLAATSAAPLASAVAGPSPAAGKPTVAEAGDKKAGASEADEAALHEMPSEGRNGAASVSSLGPDLFVRCPNGVTGVGVNREKLMVRCSRQSEEHLAMFRFLGQLMGAALRSSVLLSLDLAPLFWKTFVGQTTTRRDLEAVDRNTTELLRRLETCADAAEFEEAFGAESMSPLHFTCNLSDGTRVELVADGSQKRVAFENRLEFVRLAEWTRLHEADLPMNALRQGFGHVVPLAVLSLLTGEEIEVALCGHNTVDLELLKRHTEYGGGLTADNALIRNFWKVLEEFDQNLRLQFVEFVYAQKRLPSGEEFRRQRLRMLISPLELNAKPARGGKVKQDPDRTLPHSDTCFFNLKLPRYSCLEALRRNLTLAITSASGFGLDEEERQLNSISQGR